MSQGVAASHSRGKVAAGLSAACQLPTGILNVLFEPNEHKVRSSSALSEVEALITPGTLSNNSFQPQPDHSQGLVKP